MVYNIYQLSFEEFLSYEDKDGKYLNLTTENATPEIIVFTIINCMKYRKQSHAAYYTRYHIVISTKY